MSIIQNICNERTHKQYTYYEFNFGQYLSILHLKYTQHQYSIIKLFKLLCTTASHQR